MKRTLIGCSGGRSCPYLRSKSAARAGVMMPTDANVAATPITKPWRVTDIGHSSQSWDCGRFRIGPLRPQRPAVPVATRNDAARRQVVQFLFPQSKVAGQDVGGVGADRRGPRTQLRSARAREVRKRVVDHDFAEVWVGEPRE